jgi:hypothetical protein
MRRIGLRMVGSLVLLVLGVVAFAAPRELENKSDLVGTWRLVSATYSGSGDRFDYVPDKLVHLKQITPTHFTVVTYEAESRKVTIVGGGPYSVEDRGYREKIEYAVGGSLPNLLGKQQSFSLRLEGDRWRLSGKLTDGPMIDELWERVK